MPRSPGPGRCSTGSTRSCRTTARVAGARAAAEWTTGRIVDVADHEHRAGLRRATRPCWRACAASLVALGRQPGDREFAAGVTAWLYWFVGLRAAAALAAIALITPRRATAAGARRGRRGPTARWRRRGRRRARGRARASMSSSASNASCAASWLSRSAIRSSASVAVWTSAASSRSSGSTGATSCAGDWLRSSIVVLEDRLRAAAAARRRASAAGRSSASGRSSSVTGRWASSASTARRCSASHSSASTRSVSAPGVEAAVGQFALGALGELAGDARSRRPTPARASATDVVPRATAARRSASACSSAARSCVCRRRRRGSPRSAPAAARSSASRRAASAWAGAHCCSRCHADDPGAQLPVGQGGLGSLSRWAGRGRPRRSTTRRASRCWSARARWGGPASGSSKPAASR